VSEKQDEQMVALLGQINENVGGIRENMIRMEGKVEKQGEQITEIKADLKAEGLPTRVSMIEKTQQQQGKGFWIMVTAMAGVIAHTAWQVITGGGKQ
jgi:hypothetical protein